MCGVTGFLDTETTMGREDLLALVKRMSQTIYRRGPDDAGEWADARHGVALGFRRLAILDLTPTGHQPMCSASGRYVIVFNGEVYNFQALRAELEQAGKCPILRGGSDTEIMLACIEAWGLEQAVSRFLGMFVFALWDREEGVLHLVRDRLGVKPLYYCWKGSTLIFGSELKALKAHPESRLEVDRNALCLMMRYGYVPAPFSIYKGVYKLPPGTILSISPHRAPQSSLHCYWSVKEALERANTEPFTGTDAEAEEQLDGLLRDSVGLRMIADVPLGVFLSGGVDSSLVTALMQVQSSTPIRTFTIGFHEDSHDESLYASLVSRHLKTEHTELTLSAKDAMAVIPRLSSIYDEPFADVSQIPTLLVSELARRQVTVSLSGDGGDELFAGYSRHVWGRTVWKRMQRFSPGKRAIAASLLRSLSPQGWEKLFHLTRAILPKTIRQRNPGDKLAKLADAIITDSPEAMYSILVSHWKDPDILVPGACEPPIVLTDRRLWANRSDFTEEMLFLDTVSYLPDDILVKVDRASMAVSLEAREPLLDHRILEFAWTLPLHMKIRNGQGKWLLRQVLYRYVPQKLIERPKAGFGVPIDSWLRGPLKDWAEALLAEDLIRRQGYFDPAMVRKAWSEHLTGQYNRQEMLWNILIFQSWVMEMG